MGNLLTRVVFPDFSLADSAAVIQRVQNDYLALVRRERSHTQDNGEREKKKEDVRPDVGR